MRSPARPRFVEVLTGIIESHSHYMQWWQVEDRVQVMVYHSCYKHIHVISSKSSPPKYYIPEAQTDPLPVSIVYDQKRYSVSYIYV